jgi:hypothetical protein
LILVGGLSTLLYSYLNLKLPNEEIELGKIEVINAELAHKLFAAVGFLFIIELTITDYILYYNKKYVLPEIIVSNTFQAGQIMMFTIILLPFLLLQNYFTPGNNSFIDLRFLQKIITMGFLFFTRYQLFEAKGNYWLISKIIIQLTAVYFLNDWTISYLIVMLQK